MAESQIKFDECTADLTLLNSTAWGNNSISRIGDRVFVTFGVHLNTPLAQGSTVTIANLPSWGNAKTDVNFVYGDASGRLSYGLINYYHQQIVLVNANSASLEYVCGSFSFRADS